MQHRKIPVFYHIPKNAGTYVTDWLLIGLRHYRRQHPEWLRCCTEQYDSIKIIHVIENELIVARLLVIDPMHTVANKKTTKKINAARFDLSYSDVEDVLTDKEVLLFGVIVESPGFRTKDEILNLVDKDIELHEFLILREPFIRAQSIYEYNMSASSIDDYNHNKYHSKNFKDFILSEQLEDSWLIRTIQNLKSSAPITEADFTNTCQWLDTINIYDITQVERAITETILECYGLDTKSFVLRDWDSSKKNSSGIEKIDFNSITEKHQIVFAERTKWDKKIYDTYTKHK
jgi:hypothetical protein